MSGTPGSTGLDQTRAKEQSRQRFEAWAVTYDRSGLHRFLFRPSYMVLVEEIRRWHEERRPATFRALDVGCGTGTLVGLLAGARWPVQPVGLDYAPSMCLEAARKALASRPGRSTERARFVAGDAEHLPFAEASFDIVTCSNSFHHYPQQQEVVIEMRRLLRPGGRLILVDGFRDNVIGWFVFDVIISRVEQDVHHAPWSVIHQYFVRAGFHNIRRRKFNLWFPAFATIGDAP